MSTTSDSARKPAARSQRYDEQFGAAGIGRGIRDKWGRDQAWKN
jgi:hypothetical protein